MGWSLGRSWAVFGFAMLTGCTTLAAETRIVSSLQASEFNAVGSQYLERPTFVSVQSFSDGNVALRVLMDEYGTGYSASLGSVTEHTTYFDKRFVADYLPLIDKYLEWEALAAERGDLIEREIGVAKTWGAGGTIDLRFEIYSASPATHLLVIERCAFGTCVDKALHLTNVNATMLRNLLADFAVGKVGAKIDESVYK